MRYIVAGKSPTETLEGNRYRIKIEPLADDILQGYGAWMWVEEDDYNRLSVGQEITVDVVPVPKESVR
jgi:hypothetical protein